MNFLRNLPIAFDLQLFVVSNPPLTNIQTSSEAALTAEWKTYYERTLLERLLPNLVYAQFGQKKGIPKRGGKTIEFRRFSSLPQADFTLTEGVTPGGQNMAVTTLNATITQHGSYIAITDIVDLTALDDLLDQAAELLGEQAGLYVDTLVRDVIVAGTNVMYAPKMKYDLDGLLVRDMSATPATARVQLTNLNTFSVDAIRMGKRIMTRNKVRPIRGTPTQTAPAGGGEFVTIVHADAVYDIEGDKKWIDVAKYQEKEMIHTGEVGKIYGVRIVMSNNAKTYEGLGAASGGAQAYDAYGALMLGANAFGVIDISGSATPEFIVKPIGSAGADDPLNQRGSSGWKVLFTTRILEDYAILRIEHGFSEDVKAVGV